MPARRATPSPTLQERVRKLIDEIGVEQASRKIGLSRTTTVAIAAGLTVERGTIALAESRVSVREASAR